MRDTHKDKEGTFVVGSDKYAEYIKVYLAIYRRSFANGPVLILEIQDWNRWNPQYLTDPESMIIKVRPPSFRERLKKISPQDKYDAAVKKIQERVDALNGGLQDLETVKLI